MKEPSVIVFGATASGGQKQEIFKAFVDGVANNGYEVKFSKDRKYEPCDIAVMLGFYPEPPDTGHQQFRKQIFEGQTKNGKKCIFIDSDIFLNLSDAPRWDHYRIAYGSVYPGEAEFFNENSPSDRWELLKKRKQLEVKPWRNSGRHIVLLMQRGKEGWSMINHDRIMWANETIKEIRKHSDRPILVRPHPTAKPFKPEELHDPLGRLSISDSRNIPMWMDMKDAWAAVVFSSASSVGAILNGVPVFVSEHRCMAYPIANKNLDDIEDPIMFDREQWLHDVSYSIWNTDELREGLYWKHLMNGVGK